MNIIALQTARKGSKSVKDKNVYMYQNLPLFLHNLINSKNCKLINDVYVSTDDERILNYEWDFKNTYKTIKRPTKLCQDNSSHLETMIHGLNAIEQDLGKEVDILVVLLGNTPHAYTCDLTDAIEKFQEKFDDFDSCMSVSKMNYFNPFRSFHQLMDGSIVPIVSHNVAEFLSNNKNLNDKNCFGDIMFFNGSFWILKRETLMKHNGKSVFPWLGNKVLPFIQKSKFQEIDSEWQLKLLER